MAINTNDVNEIEKHIDYANLRKFNYEDLIGSGFIPIGIQNGIYDVLILDGDKKDEVAELMDSKLKHDAKYEFTVVDKQTFNSLIVRTDEHMASISQIKKVAAEASEMSMNAVYGDDEEGKGAAPSKTDTDRLRIGDILLKKNLVTEEQIFDALVISKKQGIPIGAVLVQKGFVSLEDVRKVLCEQTGMRALDISSVKFDRKTLAILPDDFVKINRVIPIKCDGKTLVVGMVNPGDKKVINDIVYLTGMKPQPLLITYFEFSQCVDMYYSESRKETTQYIKKIEQEAMEFGSKESLWEQAEKELVRDDSTVVKFVNKLIADAIAMRASDIHIEPRIKHYSVRYRIDGVLHEVVTLPEKTEGAILTRLKVLSKMNIAEHRRPQDGNFSIKFKDKSYDFRINTLPVGMQEKMVIRILAGAETLENSKREIDLVGATPEDIKLINRIKSAPNGIILASGPTGSGKTTTLYSILRNLNDEKINITTIEDPVEIRIEGINQSQINTKAGITFSTCLRSILRQDPDIILVGEIRDYETIETSIAAALTGHLVLSTIHTNSAASTITRLIEMGAKDYLVSSTLTGVIAQRLVRRLCPQCKQAYYPSEEEARMVLSNEDDIKKFMKMKVYKPGACANCHKDGYLGRIGIFEIMRVTKEIKRLIAMGAHDLQIEETAVGSGMRTLQQSCLAHIINGETSIAEFVRVLGPVSD